MTVDEFVKVASGLKTKFTNSLKTKELIQQIMVEFKIDVNKTYFDVPRLRIVTSDNYLTAGVGYAYKAHRDTWYSSESCQSNWWMPVYDLNDKNTMSMYPGYWDKPIKNSSEIFNYYEWCNEGRKSASSLTTQADNRKHPLPTEEVDSISETRIVLKSSEMLNFSAAHLHATAPNISGKTRFSIDFRTVHIDDLKNKKGAKNIDNKSRGSTLMDFFRCDNFEKIDESFIANTSK